MVPAGFGSIAWAGAILTIGGGFLLARVRIAPGIAVSALAVMATVVPYLRSEATPTEKAAWTAVFFVLAVIEMVAITRERREAQGQFETIIGRLTELQKTTAAVAKADAQLQVAVATVPEG